MILLSMAGCSPEKYEAEADKTVYNIIDEKWKDEYGAKANYKIKMTLIIKIT